MLEQIDQALSRWHQGDIVLEDGDFIHLASLAKILTQESVQHSTKPNQQLEHKIVCVWSPAPGFVITSQTCDIVQTCTKQPYVEVAPLVSIDERWMSEAKKGSLVAYAYVPKLKGQCLVAHLDRIMTVEKSLVADWQRIEGCTSDDERREFAQIVARKRGCFAFPDDFANSKCGAMKEFRDRVVGKHSRKSEEGAHLRALEEIRVRADPDWFAKPVNLFFWFFQHQEPNGFKPNWDHRMEFWMKKVDQSGR